MCARWFCFGYILPKLLKMEETMSRTMSMEVGMQVCRSQHNCSDTCSYVLVHLLISNVCLTSCHLDLSLSCVLLKI